MSLNLPFILIFQDAIYSQVRYVWHISIYHILLKKNWRLVENVIGLRTSRWIMSCSPLFISVNIPHPFSSKYRIPVHISEFLSDFLPVFVCAEEAKLSNHCSFRHLHGLEGKVEYISRAGKTEIWDTIFSIFQWNESKKKQSFLLS